ncbi:TolC family protein [Dokdonia sinensis]|uniref:TolC family protein n=1 Tax=Dokdonia sinensis TaxID=2479847 RepID=A0A3M0G7W4_9FLAO|nr:TolC family protein [Dokdonia sinensis]RMB57119.1 TolC family protein [Dokdonia sinensis]
MKYRILIGLVLFGSTHIFAQSKTYTLEDCLKIAFKNNLDLEAAQLTYETASVNYKQNRNALLPSINGDYNLGISRGRSIDPFTNDFVNEELTFSNARLGLDAVVFNGFRLLNSLKQSKLNRAASEMETAEAKQNLAINVTLAFLQVLNARDVVSLTATRLESTNEQVKRLETLFAEETGNPAEFRDLQGQISNDEAALILARNNLKTATLNLNQLLNTSEKIEASQLDILINFQPYEASVQEVFASAQENFPTFKARSLRVQAAQKGVAVARAQYIPEINVFANLGTNYSSAARLFTESGTAIQETGDFVNLDNQTIPVLTNQTSFTAEEITYRDQFDNNLNSVMGVAVSVPIFNGFRAKNNIALEKIKKQEAQVALERTEIEIKQAIEQSYNTMQAAYDRYNVLEKQVAAYAESFRINEIRFENGVSTSVEYIASKNNLENAQVSLATAKYEYELQVRILNYYQTAGVAI